MNYLDRRGIDPVMVENFKDHPVSIGEIRSDKSDNAADWTPRDALISLLRRIDNGEDVDQLIISFHVTEDGGSVKYLTAIKTRGQALALLARATWLVNEAT